MSRTFAEPGFFPEFWEKKDFFFLSNNKMIVGKNSVLFVCNPEERRFNKHSRPSFMVLKIFLVFVFSFLSFLHSSAQEPEKQKQATP